MNTQLIAQIQSTIILINACLSDYCEAKHMGDQWFIEQNAEMITRNNKSLAGLIAQASAQEIEHLVTQDLMCRIDENNILIEALRPEFDELAFTAALHLVPLTR